MALPSPSNVRTSLAGRVAGLIFSALFAASFGGIGLSAGWWPLLKTARAAWQVRDWQPVPATVVRSELLERHDSDSGTLYAVRAEYTYAFEGQRYIGHRVGLDTSSNFDNLGDWHERWHRELRRAQDGGSALTAWVDPQHPQRALLERDIRWSLLTLRLPFALLFTAVGAAAAWVFVSILLGRATGPGRAPTEPEAEVAASGSGLRPQRSGMIGLWIIGVGWLLICLPLVISAWSKPAGDRWVASAFFAAGWLILLIALRATLQDRRWRGARLRCVPARVHTGDAVQMHIDLPASAQVAWQPRDGDAQAGSLTLRLGLHHIDESGSGTDSRMAWEQTRVVAVQALPDGPGHCSALFDLPADAAPSGAIRANERVQWLLEVLDPQLQRLAGFEILVHRGAGAQAFGGAVAPASSLDGFRRSDWKTEFPVPAPEAAGPTPRLPAGVTVQEDEAGWRLVFRRIAARTLAVLALVACMGVAWPALAALVFGARLSHEAFPWRLPAIACLLGLALHWLSVRWTVLVADTGLQIDRSSWLWSRGTHVPLGGVRALVHKLSFTTGSGAQRVEHHALWLKAAGPRDVKLTPALAHALAARAVAWHIQDAMAHCRGRFAPGTVRLAAGRAGRPSVPAWVRALAWLCWAGGVIAFALLLAKGGGL